MPWVSQSNLYEGSKPFGWAGYRDAHLFLFYFLKEQGGKFEMKESKRSLQKFIRGNGSSRSLV